MKTRLIVLTLTISALAVAVAWPSLPRGDGGDPLPDATASRRSSAAEEAARLEEAARERPDDVAVQTRLASTYLRRARDSGDPAYYALAEKAVKRALQREPTYVGAIVAAGELALARHDFAGALALGKQGRALAPDVVASYGIITDALVELGRYEEAIAAAQAMVDRRPDFASYVRVSYIRELHGDLDGAIDAMTQAVASAGMAQDEVFGRVLLGNLHLNRGDIDAAARAYDRAAQLLPNDASALAGLARLAIARGDLAAAEAQLRAAVAQRPLPEYVIALGDLLWSQGRTREAEEQYALVRAIQQLFAASGVDTDIELALFDADHDVAPEQTYEKALAAYQRRKSVYGADVVAWAAYKAGRIDEARSHSAEALRLGTRDPRMLYHAGATAAAAGDAASAEAYLRDAVAMSAALSLPYAAAARQALDDVTLNATR